MQYDELRFERSHRSAIFFPTRSTDSFQLFRLNVLVVLTVDVEDHQFREGVRQLRISRFANELRIQVAASKRQIIQMVDQNRRIFRMPSVSGVE